MKMKKQGCRVAKGPERREGCGSGLLHAPPRGRMEPGPLYLVRPQGLHVVLAKLIVLVVNERVPAGAVHVGSLPGAEVTGREAADGRPWNGNTAWRWPGFGAEERGPRGQPALGFPGVGSTAPPISISGRSFLLAMA